MSAQFGIVTCHGFTGYPEEVEIIGEAFQAEGFAWHNVLLPGHAQNEHELRRYGWKDWAGAVLRAIDEVAKQVSGGVVMSGLSLGGLLTLYAAENSPHLRAIVPLAAPVEIFKWYHRILAKVAPGFWIRNSDDIRDETALEIHRSYSRFHTDSAKQLNALADEVRGNLHEVRVPALIVHGRHDGAIDPKNATYILEHISSERKQLLWAENSAHVLTRDFDKELVVKSALEFVRGALGTPPGA
jgi:carboxylesterase